MGLYSHYDGAHNHPVNRALHLIAIPVGFSSIIVVWFHWFIGLLLIPIAFAYGGWQTSSFVAGEMKDPSRDLPRALLIGVIAVIILYMSVTFVCLRTLGAEGLAATKTPASAVMRAALGERLLAEAGGDKGYSLRSAGGQPRRRLGARHALRYNHGRSGAEGQSENGVGDRVRFRPVRTPADLQNEF